MTKEERLKLLEKKLSDMKVYEEALYNKGLKYVAGVDEVGRGPLAGPVVAAAVVLPTDFNVLGVDDSKKLTAKKREQLYEQIIHSAISYEIGIVDNETIDRINILEATKLAMKIALKKLSLNCDIRHILIDALILKDILIPQTAIVHGDSKSISIAAASIVAKVTRDKLMMEYHKKYPEYYFDSNKGYGTKAHYDGIYRHGICPIHRRTFLKKKIHYIEEGLKSPSKCLLHTLR